MCGPSPSMSKSESDYQSEDDYRTMSRAAEIGQDKKRMAGVAKHHKKVSKSHKLVGRSIMGSKR